MLSTSVFLRTGACFTNGQSSSLFAQRGVNKGETLSNRDMYETISSADDK